MLSVYIHIPFCIRKCNYCDFTSFADCFNEVDNYISALEKEIKLSVESNKIKGKQVHTIFFGGGTPSTLSIKHIEKILKTIKKYFDVSKNCETSIEINPATKIDFIGLKALGFNRISIGVQTFDDKQLSFLGRLHNSNTAEHTILEAKKHFDNVSIDLMYGFPKQTFKSFEYNVDKAISLEVKHISAYNLIYHEGTKIDTMIIDGKCSPLSDNLENKMYDMLCSKLIENGYNHYEISNFAKPNYECKHNQNYWDRGDYIGFGLAAHSTLSEIRFSNTTDLQIYFLHLEINKVPIFEKEVLTEENIYVEKIFLGLRSRGINEKLLNKKQFETIKFCIDRDLIAKKDNTYILTSKSKFISDAIITTILNDR